MSQKSVYNRPQIPYSLSSMYEWWTETKLDKQNDEYKPATRLSIPRYQNSLFIPVISFKCVALKDPGNIVTLETGEKGKWRNKEANKRLHPRFESHDTTPTIPFLFYNNIRKSQTFPSNSCHLHNQSINQSSKFQLVQFLRKQWLRNYGISKLRNCVTTEIRNH